MVLWLMSTPAFPPRLHVLLAREAKVGLVLRRGPSKSVCSILWDRSTDRFELGQWLRGRIYERRADLSPDARHWIYFAMNGRWSSRTKGSWTAIARTPWLKAIVLLGKGDGWHGGGLFTSRREYWLNDGYGHELLEDSSEVRRDTGFRPEAYGGECPGVYYVRLQRDGWRLIEHKGTKLHGLTVFEKPAGSRWILRKIAHEQVGAPPGRGCYWDEHEIVDERSGTCSTFPDWEWADLDGNAIAYARNGCLHRMPMGRKALGEPQLLRDFTDMRFEAIEAPY
jgi:hypothetical protein